MPLTTVIAPSLCKCKMYCPAVLKSVPKVLFTKNLLQNKPNEMFSDNYDYAVPEAGTLPLLGTDNTLPMNRNRLSSISSRGPRLSLRSCPSDGKRVSCQFQLLAPKLSFELFLVTYTTGSTSCIKKEIRRNHSNRVPQTQT